jgi:hypothetical protein
MDEHEESDDEMPVATADLGEHLRTWRMFLIKLRWGLAAAMLVLALLLAFCTRG